ncbi:rhamnan synthesis F family protein [Microbacterium paulum]
MWDRRGDVEDYIPYALQGLREHCERLLVVVNGTLTEEGRAQLDPYADEIVMRENVGYDIWAHKEALDLVGADISRFDEVVLANDTWFGPVRPFGPVLSRMEGHAAHFWGMTDHAREDVNPFTGHGYLPYHLQSFWIAVRREMFESDAWRSYWRDLPEMPDYYDAVLKHEVVFTEYFSDRGFVPAVAFGCHDYPSDHPALFNPDLLLADGCPILKRRPFFHYPPFLDQHGVIGREILDEVAAYGYPLGLIWQDLARNVAPKIVNTDAAMLEILPGESNDYDPSNPLRVAALLHVFYPELTHDMMDRVDTLPSGYDVFVTTSDEEKAEQIRELIAARPARGLRRFEVRVVSNEGRDQSAFYVGCRDVLRSVDYDLVVKLHSKKTPQDGYNVGRHFRRQQFHNLLDSPAFTAGVLALFQREKGLGIVYPPMIHIGYPTMGRAWWANKEPFALLAEELGVRVPLDDVSPLAPFGGMFIARPEALSLVTDREWSYADFGGSAAYRDGGLAHVLERMPSYAAGELGYHTRTVATREYMSISHTALEYKLDQLASGIPGNMLEQIQLIRGGTGHVGEGRFIDLLRIYGNMRLPRVTAMVRRFVGRSSRLGRSVTRLRGDD